MTLFCELSPAIRCTTAIWLLILLIAYSVNLYFSLAQKKYIYAVFSALLMVISYVFLTVVQLISDYIYLDEMHSVTEHLLKITASGMSVTVFLLSAGVMIISVFNRRYRMRHVSPLSIKECADALPIGVCYYLEGGKPVFINHKMYDLSFSITGRALLNGEEFYEYVNNGPVRLIGGTSWQFTREKLFIMDKVVYELICSDVTELVDKTEQLNKDISQLNEMKRSMLEYSRNIDDLVRSREILQAKISIHNEMNKLMLASEASLSMNNEAEKKSILETWKNSSTLLTGSSRSVPSENYARDIAKLASMLGISITLKTPIPEMDRDSMTLFALASNEAITNAVKHSKAEEMEIEITDSSGMIECSFTNDGYTKLGEAREGGGLSNLRRMAEAAGGYISITADNRFCLKVAFKKN